MNMEQKDIEFMKKALNEAKIAEAEDEIPVGAIIVCQDKIIARAHNQTERLNDVTAHAEILAITAACNKLGGKYLTDCTIYVTMEPCIMCSGAIVNSRIKKLIIGTRHIKNSYTEKQHEFKIDYYKDNNIQITFGVLEEDCSTILQEFFKNLRKR